MRIAICLHGLVGNMVGKSGDSNIGSDVVLKMAYQHWDRYFIKPYNPDIFIHSWNTNLEKDMIKLFHPKDIITEEQIIFNIPKWIPGDEKRKQNHYSKWFSNKKSVDLMLGFSKKTKIKYDFVMIARFDIAWKKTIDFSKLDNKIFYIGGWTRNPVSKIKDFWFISSSKNIKKFSGISEKIEYLCTPKPGYPRGAISKSNGISNHKMAARQVGELGLKTKSILQCNDDFDPEQSDYPLIRYYYFGAER